MNDDYYIKILAIIGVGLIIWIVFIKIIFIFAEYGWEHLTYTLLNWKGHLL